MNCWFLGVALGSMLGQVFCHPANAAKPLWRTNYEEAKEIARREGKPLFLVFR